MAQIQRVLSLCANLRNIHSQTKGKKVKTLITSVAVAFLLSGQAFAYTCTHDVGPDNGNIVTCEQAQSDLKNGMSKLDRDNDGYACDRQCGD